MIFLVIMDYIPHISRDPAMECRDVIRICIHTESPYGIISQLRGLYISIKLTWVIKDPVIRILDCISGCHYESIIHQLYEQLGADFGCPRAFNCDLAH